MSSMKDRKWMQEGEEEGTIRKGGLHKSLHIPEDKKIPAKALNNALHNPNPKIRKQANLAKVFKRYSGNR